MTGVQTCALPILDLNLEPLNQQSHAVQLSNVYKFSPSLFCNTLPSCLQVLRGHLLLFQLPEQNSELGFSTYNQLPPVRARRLEAVLGSPESSVGLQS